MKLSKVLFLLFFTFVSFAAQAQSSSDLKKKREALQREIDLLQRNLTKAEKSKKLTLNQVNALKTQIRLQQRKIDIVNTQVKDLDNQITDNTSKVKNLQGQLSTLKKEYASMIRFAQRNRNSYDKMMFIFAAKSFNQAYKRIKYLQQFGQYRKKQAGYIEDKKKDLGQQIVVLDKDLKAKNDLLRDQQEARKKLVKNQEKQSVVLNKYTKQETQFKKDIAKRRRDQTAINNAFKRALDKELAAERKRVEDADRAAVAKAKAENRPVPVTKARSDADILTLAPAAAKLSAAFENNKGNLPWPVESMRVTEKFGHHKVDAAGYNNDGINIQTAAGASVKAVFSGTVSRIVPELGKYTVLIRHGKYFTIYGNLKSVNVSAGDEVSTRQSLGIAATNDDYPEIKFQIRQVGAKSVIALDPESWLAK